MNNYNFYFKKGNTMSNKIKATIGIVVLCLATIISVSVFQVMRESIPKSVLTINYVGNKTIVDPFRLERIDVKGTITDGKGDKKDISSKGFRLIDCINMAKVPEEGYNTARILSEDGYAAELTRDEARDDKKTFFIINEDKETKAQTLQLVVFGDSDSKRQVKNVTMIELNK